MEAGQAQADALDGSQTVGLIQSAGRWRAMLSVGHTETTLGREAEPSDSPFAATRGLHAIRDLSPHGGCLSVWRAHLEQRGEGEELLLALLQAHSAISLCRSAAAARQLLRDILIDFTAWREGQGIRPSRSVRSAFEAVRHSFDSGQLDVSESLPKDVEAAVEATMERARHVLQQRLSQFQTSKDAVCCAALHRARPAIVGISKFTLFRRFGRGGYGEVWAARKEDTMGLFALKVVREDKLGRGRCRRSRSRHLLLERQVLFPYGISLSSVCPWSLRSLLHSVVPELACPVCTTVPIAPPRFLLMTRRFPFRVQILEMVTSAGCPFLLPLHYAFIDGSRHILAMPLMPGGSLAAHLAERTSEGMGLPQVKTWNRDTTELQPHQDRYTPTYRSTFTAAGRGPLDRDADGTCVGDPARPRRRPPRRQAR